MSSCLSAGGRTYVLDLEILKSPSTSSSILKSPLSSSPSSTVSESATNSPFHSISTRRPRTSRKRPNQTYNEAAALLSTACPKVFSPKHFIRACKLSNRPFLNIDASPDCLIHHTPIPKQPSFRIEPKLESTPGHTLVSPRDVYDFEEDDFDTDSILDEEVGDGIDSIMGNPPLEYNIAEITFKEKNNLECGIGNRALKYVDRERELWMVPTADIVKNLPRVLPAPEKKKSVQKFHEDSTFKFRNPNSGLNLKLNYKRVQSAWSDRGSPFTDETDSSGARPRLEEIDLFPTENSGGGIREACVLRYKEKRRSRHFSKKIRYQVRKVNADRRPRMKGRFVRRMGNMSCARR